CLPRLAGGRDAERPGPQPAIALVPLLDRRLGEADFVGDLAALGVEQEAGRDGGVDPHAAMAAGEQREVLVEAVADHARRAVLVADVDIELDGFLPGVAVVAGLPLHVEELAAPG